MERYGSTTYTPMISKIKSDTPKIMSLIEERDLDARERNNAAQYCSMRFVEQKKLLRIAKNIWGDLADVVVCGYNGGYIGDMREDLKSITYDKIYILIYRNEMRYVQLCTNTR